MFGYTGIINSLYHYKGKKIVTCHLEVNPLLDNCFYNQQTFRHFICSSVWQLSAQFIQLCDAQQGKQVVRNKIKVLHVAPRATVVLAFQHVFFWAYAAWSK